MARVLVTGGTGFVGAHCLIQLLAAGHETRATVRDLKRESDVRAMLRQGGAGEVGERLKLFRADLNADAGWAEAAYAVATTVLHVASPFPSTVPKDENELIAPGSGRGAARAQGRARRRRQARGADLVLRGHWLWRPERPDRGVHGKGLDEPKRSDRAALSEIKDNRRARSLGFHRARRAAAWSSPWSIRSASSGLSLDRTLSTSIVLVKRLLDGSLPGCPDLWFGAVDVRDVADLHLKA